MRTVSLDEDLAALIEGEKPLDEAAREALVIDLFRRRKISTGKACELLRLDRMDFIRRANEHNVPVYLTTAKEWAADLAALDACHPRTSCPTPADSSVGSSSPPRSPPKQRAADPLSRAGSTYVRPPARLMPACRPRSSVPAKARSCAWGSNSRTPGSFSTT